MIKRNIIIFLFLLLILFFIIIVIDYLHHKEIIMIFIPLIVILTLILINLMGFIYSIKKTKKVFFLIFQFIIFCGIFYLFLFLLKYFYNLNISLIILLPIITNILSYYVVRLLYNIENNKI